MKYKEGDKIILTDDEDELEDNEIPQRFAGETVVIEKTKTSDGVEWYRFDNDIALENMDEETYEDNNFWVKLIHIKRLEVIKNWKKQIGGK